MAGVTRVYVYRFTPPGDALTLATAMFVAGEKLAQHNKNVVKVETDREGEDMLLRITFKGHDQWWIKKKIIYPVASILTKCGIKVKDVQLVAVERPPDPRGRKPQSETDPDEMIDHSDMGLVNT